MSAKSSSPRRSVLAAPAVALAISVLAAQPISAAGETAIRPFQVHVPEATLVELRKRIAQTRWPDKETVADQSQGAQLAKLQALVRYWGSGYDWRKAETKLNALPQFTTSIE